VTASTDSQFLAYLRRQLLFATRHAVSADPGNEFIELVVTVCIDRKAKWHIWARAASFIGARIWCEKRWLGCSAAEFTRPVVDDKQRIHVLSGERRTLVFEYSVRCLTVNHRLDPCGGSLHPLRVYVEHSITNSVCLRDRIKEQRNRPQRDDLPPERFEAFDPVSVTRA
jgi:hypothetical protein